MRISDWSSDVCSSDLGFRLLPSFVDQFNADDQGNKASWATGDDGVFKSVFFMPAGAVSVLRSCRHMLALDACRSEERRVGQECVSTCRSRWSASHSKKKNTYSNYTHHL